MRCAETLAGLAVKVLIEEKRISPRRIVLEARICSMRRAPTVRVEQKQTQKTALEFRGDLTQIHLYARSGR
jgi:2C-methyl-D-erythritol 2,4-cyclodiphosphate synthase